MSPTSKRPPFVTLLAVVVFILSAASLASLAAGLSRWHLFADLRLALPLWLILTSGSIWGIIWLVVAWGLWRLLPWARRTAIVCFIVYLVVNIGQQGLFAHGDYERARLPFIIGASVLLGALVTWGLTRPRVQQAFEQSGEELKVDNGKLQG
jgi:hypothetical protein